MTKIYQLCGGRSCLARLAAMAGFSICALRKFNLLVSPVAARLPGPLPGFSPLPPRAPPRPADSGGRCGQGGSSGAIGDPNIWSVAGGSGAVEIGT